MIRLIFLSVGQRVEQKGFIKKQGLEKNVIENENDSVLIFLISSNVMHFNPNCLKGILHISLEN